jgi:thiol-disulfide isomerase/thioredoxin
MYGKYLILLLGIFLSRNLWAQQDTIRLLKLGEKMPDIPLVLNVGNATRQVHLSDYNGKMIIMDYWNVNCSTCIELMPHMLELQQHFKDKVQVILINPFDTKEQVQKFWSTLKITIGNTGKGKAIINAYGQLASVISGDGTHYRDNPLWKLFQFNAVPTHVWIDGSGIYRHIISGSESFEDVNAFLAGQQIRIEEYGQGTTLELNHPFSWVEKLPTKLEYYSILMSRVPPGKTRPSSGAIMIDSATKKQVGFSVQNITIFELYQRAYADKKADDRWMFYPKNKIILEVNNLQEYLQPAIDDPRWLKWITNHTFCYAMKVPVSQADRFYDIFKQDIDKIFQIHSRIESRKIKCLILRRIDSEDKLKTIGGVAKTIKSVNTPTGIILDFKNVPFRKVFEHLSNMIDVEGETNDEYNKPFLDETNYQGNVDMEFPVSNGGIMEKSTPLTEILNILRTKYGLELIEEYRDINVLVLTEDGYKPDVAK